MSKAQEFWRSHVQGCGRSRTEIEAYARKHGLNEATLRWWRSRLNQAAKATEVSSRFVAVRVTEAVPQSRSAGARLRLGDGLLLELSELPSPQWLAQLAQAVRGLG